MPKSGWGKDRRSPHPCSSAAGAGSPADLWSRFAVEAALSGRKESRRQRSPGAAETPDWVLDSFGDVFLPDRVPAPALAEEAAQAVLGREDDAGEAVCRGPEWYCADRNRQTGGCSGYTWVLTCLCLGACPAQMTRTGRSWRPAWLFGADPADPGGGNTPGPGSDSAALDRSGCS